MPAQHSPSPSGQPGRPGWRRGPRPSPGGGRAPRRKDGGWSKREDRDYEHAARWHRIKMAFWSLLFVVLIVSFLVWLIWTPMRTPFLVVAVAEYPAPAAPNAWAKEDAERLRDLDDEEILKYLSVDWTSKESGLRNLRSQLDAAEPGGPGKDLVIIYLSMHGLVDDLGEPCLLPPGASPLKSDQWLRLRELLKHLFPKDKTGAHSDRTRKLLILDCNRMDANWNLGMLYNAFADRLRDVVEDAKVPGLAVLNSTSPGQIGWAAPELNNSVFAYFLWQGLKGAADAERPGDGDGTVSLRELHDYLKAHVGQWVTEKRADVQQPMLLRYGDGFPEDAALVFAQSHEKTVIASPMQGDERSWGDVHALWLRHAELSKTAPYRRDPLRWEEFQRKLLRLEQLVEAGNAYETEFYDTEKELDTLANKLAEGVDARDLAAHSLPLARQFAKGPTNAQREEARSRLNAALEAKPAAGPSEPDAAPQKAAEGPERESSPDDPAQRPEAEAPPEGPRETPKEETGSKQPAKQSQSKADTPYGYPAAAAAWDWALDPASRRQKLPEVRQFVAAAERQPDVDVVELHFLRMLESYLDPQLWQSAPGHVTRALEARDLAEAAAAPADPRAYYWCQPLVDHADRDRRLAEDKLFVGAEDALSEADSRWKRVAGENGKGGMYREAIAQAEEVAEAFALRDRAWAEIPYLAQWLLARLYRPGAAQLDDLRDVLDGTHQLAAELDDSLQSGAWTPELETQTAALRKKLDGLRIAFLRECSDLKDDAGGDKLKLRAIAGALALPLVTGKQRNDLREEYLTIARRIDASGIGYRVTLSEGTADEPVAGKQTDDAAQFLDRLARWKVHPALAILSRTGLDGQKAAAGGPTGNGPANKTPSGEPSASAREKQLKDLAAQGKQVRGLLAGVPADAGRWLRETETALKRPTPESPARTRAGRSKADRLVRASAALMNDPLRKELSGDPAAQLRDLDLHFLLLWHAGRALDDFWGPAPGRDTCFFEIAARDYLDSARRLCKNDPRGQQIAALLDLRRQTVREGIRPEKPRDLVVDEKEPSTRHRLSVALPENLPPGEAAVYLQEPGGRPCPVCDAPRQEEANARRMPVPVAGAGTYRSPDYWIANNAQLRDASILQAAVLYRGHFVTRDFYVQPAAGLDLIYHRPEYPAPTITVYGQAKKRSSAMFVFDCSGSMGNRATTNRQLSTRLDVARDTLLVILNRLAEPRSPYRVGLRIYGHRVGWHPQNPQQIVIRDPKNPRDFVPRPPQLAHIHPSNDVESVLKPGVFIRQDYEEASRKLQSLRNLGETPLYLAIIQAIDDLRSETEVDQKRVVAITDGFNRQSGSGAHRKNLNDLQSKLRQNKNVRLDIVGFHLKAADTKEEQTLNSLKTLAKSTGGGFHPASDPDSLLRALEKSLGLSQYEVRTVPGGRNVTSQPLDLNTTCNEIPPTRGRAVSYLVKLTDRQRPAEAEVEVRGGEALELWLDEDRQRLVHRRYDKALRDSCDRIPAPRDEKKRSFFIGAHLPDWDGSAARFFLSVQNSDPKQFSPRPEEMWVQVRPVLPPAHPQADVVYSFFDLRLEPDHPVPVFSCLAPNWPSGAERAQIRVWCKLKRTPPGKVVTVADFGQQPPQLPGAPGMTFEIESFDGETSQEPFRVIVTQRYSTSDDLPGLKVEMLPAPDKIKRRFNAKKETIWHTFFYDDSVAGEVESYRVLLTTRDQLVAGAIATPRPLEVWLTRD